MQERTQYTQMQPTMSYIVHRKRIIDKPANTRTNSLVFGLISDKMVWLHRRLCVKRPLADEYTTNCTIQKFVDCNVSGNFRTVNLLKMDMPYGHPT